MTFISGSGFYKISKWSLCPRYTIKYDHNSIMENDKIFINLDYFDSFITTLNNNPPQNKFILITHNSDKSFTEEHFNKIEKYVNKVYAINNIFNHHKVITIPIGFRDYPVDTMSIINKIDSKKINKKILLYMNFVLKTNYNKRIKCYDRFKTKSWVTKEKNINIKKFYSRITKSKYILSPEGTGIDCHRVYESIYFNSIPILKTSKMDSYYKDLPVLIVNSWKDVTEKFLINNYSHYYKKLKIWKKNNPDWLNPEFWCKD